MPAMFISSESKLMVALANYLSDLFICGELRYVELQTPVINIDKRFQRLILCFIDFSNKKGVFNYEQ